jgi:regulator of replication initiation timing
MLTIEQLTTEIQNLVREVQRLVQETNQLKLATQLANPVKPLPVPTPDASVMPPRPAGPNTGGAANHLANILNGGSHVVAPHAPPQPILPPEVMARYTDDQKAYVDAFRSLGPMGAFHMHLQPPNLNNYKNDHAYIWPGHALIASHPGGTNPRTI